MSTCDTCGDTGCYVENRICFECKLKSLKDPVALAKCIYEDALKYKQDFDRYFNDCMEDIKDEKLKKDSRKEYRKLIHE